MRQRDASPRVKEVLDFIEQADLWSPGGRQKAAPGAPQSKISGVSDIVDYTRTGQYFTVHNPYRATSQARSSLKGGPATEMAKSPGEDAERFNYLASRLSNVSQPASKHEKETRNSVSGLPSYALPSNVLTEASVMQKLDRL